MVTCDGPEKCGLHGASPAFSDARFVDGGPAYEVVLSSESGGLVTSDTGTKVETVQLDKPLLSHSSPTVLPVASPDQEIRNRAYELYLTRGAEPDLEVEDWLRDERELTAE